MDTIIPSLIRTYVPLGIGVLVSWLASLGITVDDTARAALVAGVGALVSAVYYALIRVAEQHVPALGWLLGSPKSPDSYSTDTTSAAGLTEVDEAADDTVDAAPEVTPGA